MSSECPVREFLIQKGQMPDCGDCDGGIKNIKNCSAGKHPFVGVNLESYQGSPPVFDSVKVVETRTPDMLGMLRAIRLPPGFLPKT